MNDDPELDKLVAQERVKLEEEERQKRILYDRNIGGANVPRPSPDFIERNVGPLRSPKELEREAQERAQKILAQQERDQIRRAEAERSLDRHNQSIEKRRAVERQEQIKREMREARERRSQNRNRGPERD